MNEIQRIIISFILFILWSVGCFLGGYLLCNRQAIKRINESNQQLEEQQRKYENLIRESEQRISDIRKQLYGTISNNEQATEELSGIIEQIRKQKLNL